MTEAAIKLSEREAKALSALAECFDPDGYGFLSFKTIAKRSGLDPLHVRRTVRALARKGCAEYGSGLWTDEGEMAGSGYSCTKKGFELSQGSPGQ